MTHRNIKRFSIDGEFISDADIPLTRSKFEQFLVHDMRRNGYVQVLDLETAWSTKYDTDNNRWFFTLTIQGVYVGKKRAKQCEGLLKGALVERNTQKIK